MSEKLEVLISGMRPVIGSEELVWYAVYSGSDKIDIGPKQPVAFFSEKDHAKALMRLVDWGEFGSYEHIKASARPAATGSPRLIDVVLKGVEEERIYGYPSFEKSQKWHAVYFGMNGKPAGRNTPVAIFSIKRHADLMMGQYDANCHCEPVSVKEFNS